MIESWVCDPKTLSIEDVPDPRSHILFFNPLPSPVTLSVAEGQETSFPESVGQAMRIKERIWPGGEEGHEVSDAPFISVLWGVSPHGPSDHLGLNTRSRDRGLTP